MDRVISHFDARRCARSALTALLITWISAADFSQAAEHLRDSARDPNSLPRAFHTALPCSPVNFLAQHPAPRIVQCTEEKWGSSTPATHNFGELRPSLISSPLHRQSLAAIEPNLIAAIPDCTQVRLRL